MKYFNLAIPWLFLLFVVGTVTWDCSHTRETVLLDVEGQELAAESVAPRDHEESTAKDPVCNMVVRTATAYRVVIEGHSHYFCSSQCRDEAIEDPGKWLLGNSDEMAARSMSPSHHLMRGIPPWMYQFAIAIVLFLSFGIFELLSWYRISVPQDGRIDLLPPSSKIRKLLKWRPLRFSVQLLMVVCFILIIVAGLFGNQNPTMNIAPLATWTLWWAGLIFFVLFFGKLWCSVCPWDALAGWAESLTFWGTSTRNQGLELQVPRWLRNIWPTVFLFIFLTWLELGKGAVKIPRITAYMAMGMFGMALVGAFIFGRKAFCRYGCLVGQVSGLYSNMSPTELRVVNTDICASCTTLDCYKGNSEAVGCPVFEYPRVLNRNTYCTMCTECLHSCPEDNISIRLRPWGADLSGKGRQPRMDEAILALVLLCVTAFHGLAMTPRWGDILAQGHELTGLVSPSAVFILTMAIIVVAPALVFAGLCYLTARLSGGVKTIRVFLSYSYALLPIALFYHLAHNIEHFLFEGPRIIALISDPLGKGWNLFGTAHWNIPPLLTLEGLWILQVVFIVVGHVYGLWLSEKTTRRLIPSRKRGFVAQLPMMIAMILSSMVSLWLLSQPMLMRG